MFWLRVRGDSMTGDGIFHGDLVLVLPQPFVEQNQIAVVMVDCDATVKRFRREGNVVKLIPGNPDYPVMEYRGEDGEVSVVGRVVALYREFEGP
jgi:repressor LexA